MRERIKPQAEEMTDEQLYEEKVKAKEKEILRRLAENEIEAEKIAAVK